MYTPSRFSLLGVVVLGVALVALLLAYAAHVKAGVSVNTPYARIASSTIYTISSASATRVVATTTGATGQRIGLLLQPLNCGATTDGVVYLNAEGKSPSATDAFLAYGSTTLQLGNFPEAPAPQNAVLASTTAGTCQLAVTEFFANN